MTSVSVPGEALDNRKDKLALFVFLTILVALSLAFDLPLVMSGSLTVWNGWAVFLLMWAPGVAGLFTSAIVYRSLRPLGLLGNRRVLAWSVFCLALPILYTLVIYPTLKRIGLIETSMSSIGFAFVTLGLMQSAMSAFGEELGWRGFASPLFTRFFGFGRGQLALGAIWYLYHLPSLLFTEYGGSSHPVFGNLMFLVSVMALSALLGWARQDSDSVWPSTLYHASHNLFFFSLFYPIVPQSELAGWLVGEQGAALAILTTAAAAAVVLVRRGVFRPEGGKKS